MSQNDSLILNTIIAVTIEMCLNRQKKLVFAIVAYVGADIG